MAATFFVCIFRLGGNDHYVIWHSNDHDGLVREAGRLVSFPSLTDLEAYSGTHGLTLQPDEPVLYDWDALARWCDAPVASAIAPHAFLNAWNMLLDVQPPGGEPGLFQHAHERGGTLYDKLFRANNLPAMTPPGAEYEPMWTRADVAMLAQLLRLGLGELRHQVHDREAI